MTPSGLARSYLDALIGRDYGRMTTLLADRVVLRDLSPPGYTEVSGIDRVLAFLSGFLDTFEAVELVDSEVYDVGPVTYGRLRMRLFHIDDGATLLEQHHLLAVSDGRIDRIDELCTGQFTP